MNSNGMTFDIILRARNPGGSSDETDLFGRQFDVKCLLYNFSLLLQIDDYESCICNRRTFKEKPICQFN